MYSISPIIREMQFKTSKRYLTRVRKSVIKKDKREQMLVRMWRKDNPCTLLVGM